MAEIQINYDEVYMKTTELKGYIKTDILPKIETAYMQIQEMLNELDSGTNQNLKESMELNKQKSIVVAQTLYKLLSFMSNSSKQMELNEQKMAATIMLGAASGKGAEQ